MFLLDWWRVVFVDIHFVVLAALFSWFLSNLDWLNHGFLRFQIHWRPSFDLFAMSLFLRKVLFCDCLLRHVNLLTVCRVASQRWHLFLHGHDRTNRRNFHFDLLSGGRRHWLEARVSLSSNTRFLKWHGLSEAIARNNAAWVLEVEHRFCLALREGGADWRALVLECCAAMRLRHGIVLADGRVYDADEVVGRHIVSITLARAASPTDIFDDLINLLDNLFLQLDQLIDWFAIQVDHYLASSFQILMIASATRECVIVGRILTHRSPWQSIDGRVHVLGHAVQVCGCQR